MPHRSTIPTALAAVTLLGTLCGPVLAAGAAVDTTVTFTKDVLPILQQNCQTCHRNAPIGVSGMIAPMPLETYDEVRPWARSVAKMVESREMPPWSAAPSHHGLFEGERVLTDHQIDTIVRWARSGAPQGDPADAPPPRSFVRGKWWLGEPDVVVPLPEPVWVGDEVADWQPTIEIPLTEDILPEDRWVRAIECVAGSKVVHHVVVFAYGPGMERDRGDGGVGGNLGGLAPGAEPAMMREGYGILLKKGTTLGISMHYHKEAGPGTGAWDRSEIGLHFYPKDAELQNVQISAIGNLQFEIPPGVKNWPVGMSRTFDRPVTLLSMLPHMHFRGTAAKYTAFYPDGRQEVLLEVPKYSYAWQHNYRFKEPRKLPPGTRIDVELWFDNSTENPVNPNPQQTIRFGAPTTDEMALGYIYYAFDDEPPSLAGGYGAESSTGGK